MELPIERFNAQSAEFLRNCIDSGYSKASMAALETWVRLSVDTFDTPDAPIPVKKCLSDLQLAYQYAQKQCEERQNGGGESAQKDEIDSLFPLYVVDAFTESVADVRDSKVASINISAKDKDCNCVIVESPFVEETDLYAFKLAKINSAKLRWIDVSLLGNMETALAVDTIGRMIRQSRSERVVFYFREFGKISDNGKNMASVVDYLTTVLGFIKSGTLKAQLVFSNTDSAIWLPGVMQGSVEGAADCFSEVPVITIPLPSYQEVSRLISDKFCGEEPSDSFASSHVRQIRGNGVHLGYCGLANVLDCADWSEAAAYMKAQAAAKRELLANFAKALKMPFALIDSEWNYQIERDSVSTETEAAPIVYKTRYDYDRLPEFDFAKLDAIMNDTSVDLFEKLHDCAIYCLTGGDDQFYYDADKPQKLLRWQTLYENVCELLRLPIGEIVFDIDESEHLNGQCCGNGAKIRMLESFLFDADSKCNRADRFFSSLKTFFHEMYHAVQYKASQARSGDDGAFEYYRRNLGIEENRASFWAANNNHYVTESDNPITQYLAAEYVGSDEVKALLRNFYYYQLMETDANIFAGQVLKTIVCRD